MSVKLITHKRINTYSRMHCPCLENCKDSRIYARSKNLLGYHIIKMGFEFFRENYHTFLVEKSSIGIVGIIATINNIPICDIL